MEHYVCVWREWTLKTASWKFWGMVKLILGQKMKTWQTAKFISISVIRICFRILLLSFYGYDGIFMRFFMIYVSMEIFHIVLMRFNALFLHPDRIKIVIATDAWSFHQNKIRCEALNVSCFCAKMLQTIDETQQPSWW